MSNYKMVCIDNIDNTGLYTTGKVYEVKDGVFEADNGEEIIAGSFDEWEKESTAKWSLVDFDIKEQVIHLFRLCMQVKEKGHDAFFEYHAHINVVTVKVYINGWKRNEKEVYDRMFWIYLDKKDAPKNIKELKIAEEYLKELIECTSPTT